MADPEARSKTRPARYPSPGQVALVTGAASGIGLALTAALARRGLRVIAADLSIAVVRAAIASIENKSRDAIRPVTLDVTDAEGFRSVVSELLTREGRLDLVFNNAGIGLACEVQDLDLADARRLIDVNLLGVMNGVAAAYPPMINQGSGCIVNTASGAALGPRPGMAVYAATKAGVVSYSLSLLPEAALSGVQVCVVCPGFVRTNIQRNSKYVRLDPKALGDKIPLKPIAPEACAERVLRGIERREPLITVPKAAWFEWMLGRISLRLALRIGGWRARQFRAARR